MSRHTQQIVREMRETLGKLMTSNMATGEHLRALMAQTAELYEGLTATKETQEDRETVGGEPSMSVVGDGLWDASDVAAYLKLSRSWVYRAAEIGVIPRLDIGGSLRFDPAAIRAYAMARSRAEPTVLKPRKGS